MSEITWREPPRRPSGRKFEAEAREMREHPGQWLLLDAYLPEEGALARSAGNSVKIGRFAALRPAGAFEARTATETGENGHKRVYLYARYVGNGSS